ncbi:MazG-like family protein [Streptomyces sp. NPDC018019]|uniref:MazG-like family protein n=1 Tax=Streptomyces sp. NPDC018019 TaxID=3365030 RepID=UPI00379C1C70
MTTSWRAITRLTAWLDERDSISDRGESTALRILKLSEEVGEVAEAYDGYAGRKPHKDMARQILKLTQKAGKAVRAYIGYTGQNPRKGFTHTKHDVLEELTDVAVTALVAMESLAPLEAEAVFQKRIERLCERVQWKSERE